MVINDCFVVDATQRDVQDTNKNRRMNLILAGRCSAVIKIRYLHGTSQTQCRLNILYLQNIMFKNRIVKIVHIQKISRHSRFKSSEYFLKLLRVLKRRYTTFELFKRKCLQCEIRYVCHVYSEIH
jgi:hypothetical protein